MPYDLIQSVLTLAIEATATIGFGAIALHGIWQQHTRFMQEFCPPVKPYQEQEDDAIAHYVDQFTHAEELLPEELVVSDTVREIIQSLTQELGEVETAIDPWEEGVEEGNEQVKPTRLAVRHFSPQLALPPAQEKESKTQTQVNLEDMDAHSLRKVCNQLNIAWRNVRGKNRHMKADTMRFQIRQRLENLAA